LPWGKNQFALLINNNKIIIREVEMAGRAAGR
jgi:hypothetical protein